MATFDYPLLDATLFRCATKLASDARPLDSRRHAADPDSTGAIVLAAAAIEAAVNLHVERVFLPDELLSRVSHPRRELYRIAKNHLRGIRRGGPREKVKALARILELEIAWSDEPWRSLNPLHLLRNQIVHYQGRATSSISSGTYVPNKEVLIPLARRLGFDDSEKNVWPEVLLTKPTADWAVNTAHLLRCELRSEAWSKLLR